MNTVTVSTNTYEPLTMQIYSLVGTKVVEDLNFTGSQKIDLSGIGNGIYLLHFLRVVSK